MIRGLDRFREHFAGYQKAFVLIGGVACHEWLASQRLEFRATKDIDIVLVVEALDQAFVKRFWEFIEAGKYQAREKATGDRELYRFHKPQDETYPVMLEIFSRKPLGIELGAGQHIVPVKFDEALASLSAILLDDAYYKLIVEQHNEEKNLPFANPASLIPLKARAWLDFAARSEPGEKVEGKDIAKHRTDVFRIAATLPGGTGPSLPESIKKDLNSFLAAFPMGHREWPAVLAGLKTTIPGNMKPEVLIEAIRTYFALERILQGLDPS
jgi:Nucleotidyl transferase AbiEii toxin, Type IV TA system